jgi:hypothetical protein
MTFPQIAPHTVEAHTLFRSGTRKFMTIFVVVEDKIRSR